MSINTFLKGYIIESESTARTQNSASGSKELFFDLGTRISELSREYNKREFPSLIYCVKDKHVK